MPSPSHRTLLAAILKLAILISSRGVAAFVRHRLVISLGSASATTILPASRRLTSSRTMLFSEGPILGEESVVAGKVKGPKGGHKPPIFAVPSERRLFDAQEGLLLHDVKCFSLYHFTRVSNPEAAAEILRSSLSSEQSPLENFAGTIYVAEEGINAQFAVVSSQLSSFETSLRGAVSLALDNTAAGDALDLNMGALLPARSPAPFKRFRVVNRPQILTDGLPPTIADLQEEGTDNTGKEWDWSGEVGIELEASQWHQELSAAKKKEEAHVGDGSEEVSSFPVLLDCRNDYESDAGRFQGAKALNTATFSESWAALDEAVAALPNKDAPVYTYCTGGIRCVKVGAYLVQKHGLTNVRRLKHGIIGYERWVNQEAVASDGGTLASVAEGEEEPSEPAGSGIGSIWEGDNFIFDQRRIS